MAYFYSCTLFFLLGVAQAADNVDHVQIAVKSANTTNKTQAIDGAHALLSGKHQTQATSTCELTYYQHWHEDKGETGDSKTVQGIGNFPLEALGVTGMSTVKVAGESCVAWGYKTVDCSGAPVKGKGIEAGTQYFAGDPKGVVGPSHNMEEFYGCNDCILCMRVESDVGAVTISGFKDDTGCRLGLPNDGCGLAQTLACNGVFRLAGQTASGAPYYKGQNAWYYHDLDCKNSGATWGMDPQWQCSKTAPNIKLTKDLDEDDRCLPLAFLRTYYPNTPAYLDPSLGIPIGTKGAGDWEWCSSQYNACTNTFLDDQPAVTVQKFTAQGSSLLMTAQGKNHTRR